MTHRKLIEQMLDCIEELRYSSNSFMADRKIAAAREAAREYLAAPDEDDYCPTCGELDGGTGCGVPNCGLVTGGDMAAPETVVVDVESTPNAYESRRRAIAKLKEVRHEQT